MSSLLDGVSSQNLHHLLNDSKWSSNEVMDFVCISFISMLTDLRLEDELCIAIDESGFSKKGNQSAGVQRQYNGNAGKVDNCQVGVFASLLAGSLRTLVDARLYEPKTSISKIELAKESIYHLISDMKVDAKCVLFDSFYGRDLTLLCELDSKGIRFIGDVPETHHIHLNKFQMRIPKKLGVRGREPIYPKPTEPSCSIKNYISTLKRKDWKKIQIRNSTKGIITSLIHTQKIYLLNPLTGRAKEFLLYIRKDKDGSIYQAVTNFNEATPIQDIAYFHSKRYFIERSFQDCKSSLGMNQYQIRSKTAWTKHMALCMLAYLFIQKLKTEAFLYCKKYLSTEKIKKLISSMISFSESVIKKVIEEIWSKPPSKLALTRKMFYLRI